jgi:hypothetical protein
VEDDVEGGAAVVVHELLDFVPSLGLGDLLLDGDGTADGGDGGEVDGGVRERVAEMKLETWSCGGRREFRGIFNFRV